MRIAVLALQGAFIEHEQMLQRLGVETFQIRQLKDWQQPKDGLILPGGESTVQMRLLSQLGLHEPIREAILGGLPVFGTCAGMILLSKGYLGTMDILVRRNAYGRQLGSFHTVGTVEGIGKDLVRRNAYGRQLGSFHTVGTVEGIGKDLPMTFIRAPYIETVLSDACIPMASIDGHIVAARQGNQLAAAFHPELDCDPRIHQFFLERAK